MFTVGFSGLCFAGAAIWQYENMAAFKRHSQTWRDRQQRIKEQLDVIFGREYKPYAILSV